tara:strand:- start:4168 stop:4371 length:204 start_codon:yes stop_codon:yes gene_type:complete
MQTRIERFKAPISSKFYRRIACQNYNLMALSMILGGMLAVLVRGGLQLYALEWVKNRKFLERKKIEI